MKKDIHNYDDIIDLEPHKSSNHPPMEKINRAAQFAPFAALIGYAEAINETGREVERKKILSIDEKDIINQKLNYLNEHIKDNISIDIIYFVKDVKKKGGSYQSKRGLVRKIDEYEGIIQFIDKSKINIKDIIEIKYDDLNHEIY